ncbi:MAG TPA: helix-turn-helix domain-containing protein [Candidatus Saccharimonadales bacterium]
MNNLIEQLAGFGLSTIEARVYLHLVNKPAKTILELARELDMPRTSVYDATLKLAEKGLIQKIVTFKSQKVQAYPLGILQTQIDKERQRVEKLQEKLTELEATVTMAAASPFTTEVRYFNGVKGFQQIMWNVLKAEGEIVGYSQFGRIEVVGEKFAVRHAAETARRGIKDRVITNPRPETLKYLRADPLADSRRIFQTTRVLPTEKLYVTGDTSIYNNVFAVTFWKQGEIVGVEIENAELVRMQKSIFELLWTQTEPLEKYL